MKVVSVIKKMGVMLNLFQHRKDMATLKQVQGDNRLDIIDKGKFYDQKVSF